MKTKSKKQIDKDIPSYSEFMAEHDRIKKIINRMEVQLVDKEVDSYNSNSGIEILEFTERLAKELDDSLCFGTALNYRRTAKSLRHFLGNKDFLIARIDQGFISRYNLFLIKRGILKNSISFYMRNLRAILNKAAELDLIDRYQCSCFFKKVYTGIDQTHKKAISKTSIHKLQSASLENYPELQKVRDLFMFSFYTRGMAFVDMAFLKKNDVKEGKIIYRRHKTQQLINVRLEQSMVNIIKRYERPDSIYLLPILKSTDPDIAYKEYINALNLYNKRLKNLAEITEIRTNLSSYTARHSWATIAHQNDIPLSIISASLGHNSENTTQIYLKSIGNSIIDKTNRKIMKLID